MAMKKLIGLLGVSLAFLSFQAVDDGPLRILSGQLMNYLRSFPSEKVYLHTDRDRYAAGDDLWLKAYLVDGLLHQADSASGTLYVQLAKADGTVLETRVLRVEAGYAQGDFALDDSLPDGHYQLVAFTNWMRNRGPEFFFRKNIEILNSRRAPAPAPEPPAALDVQFFPEGGQLVNGLRSRVAFKAIDQSGRGVPVEGSIATADGQVVSPLKTEHAGMGLFLLKPEKGKQYVATLRSPNGSSQRFVLPAALDSGVVLTIDNSLPSNLKVSVTESAPGSQDLYLVGHIRGQVRYMAELPRERSAYFYVNRSLFPDDGIVHFTVFNKDLLPLSERLVFNQVQKPLRVAITPDQPTYLPHQKVTLQISVTDAANRPVAAELSLAATDAGAATPPVGFAGIYSYLLLSSDLKGTIEDPDYYFNPANEKAPLYLDLLMMTHGWRRFVWQEVLRDVYAPPAHPLQAALPVSGRLLLPGQKPAENLDFTLIAQTGTRQQFLNGTSGAGGSFAFADGAVYNSSTQFTVRTRNKGEINVLLNPLTVPAPPTLPVPFVRPLTDRNTLASFLKNAENWQELEELIRQEEQKLKANPTPTAGAEAPAKGRKSRQSQPQRTTGSADPRRSIYGAPDTTFPLDDNMRNGFSDILQVLKGRVPGVTVNGNQVLIRGISTVFGSTEPLFLVDGIASSKSVVLSLSVRDVEAIDVLKGPSASAFGTRGSNGVINVLTRRYEEPEAGPAGNSRSTIGYAIAREFYAPRYDLVPTGQFPDRRPTLHWAPSVRTGADGKATLSYWNSASPTQVRVEVQAATPRGSFGTGRLSYPIR
jgi:hypothetical protein